MSLSSTHLGEAWVMGLSPCQSQVQASPQGQRGCSSDGPHSLGVFDVCNDREQGRGMVPLPPSLPNPVPVS